MRTQFNLVTCMTLFCISVSSFLWAGDQPREWLSPYPPVSAEISGDAPEWADGLSVQSGTVWYGFSWDQALVPAAASDLRDPMDGRVFTTEVDPSIRVGVSRASLQLHRRGLKYHGANDAWSVGLRYHRLKVAPDLELLIDQRTERPNVLKVEWSVRFD